MTRLFIYRLLWLLYMNIFDTSTINHPSWNGYTYPVCWNLPLVRFSWRLSARNIIWGYMSTMTAPTYACYMGARIVFHMLESWMKSYKEIIIFISTFCICSTHWVIPVNMQIWGISMPQCHLYSTAIYTFQSNTWLASHRFQVWRTNKTVVMIYLMSRIWLKMFI